MVKREAQGDFDYRGDAPSDVDGLTTADRVPEQEAPADFGYLSANPEDDADEATWDRNGEPVFDAFNADTWRFTPNPAPWYRGKQAMTVLAAAAAAVIALVVSAVLLVFRGQTGTVGPSTPVTSTATATSAAAASTASSVAPLPPPPPAPPPQSAAAPVNPAPNYGAPAVEPTAPRQPEIGVTRTPITRSSLSVAPQPRHPPTPPPPTGGGGRSGH